MTDSATVPLRRASLTDGRRLARNTVWNLAAQLLPLLVALLCIPVLIDQAGVARLGIWTLGLALIGYSGMFDLGLGRALTKLVAEQLGRGEETACIAATGLLLMTAFGVIGGLLLWPASDWLVHGLLKVPSDLSEEAVTGFRLIAVSVPIVTLNIGLRGILEAHQEFRTVAVVNALMGLVTFAGAVAALQVHLSAPAMISALVVARVLGVLAYGAAVWRQRRGFGVARVSRIAARRLIRFGSWMTLSNVVGPIMDYMDRFIIGALLSVAAVAYYATPFDVVSRLGTVAGALAGVLFPAMASTLVTDRQRAASLYLTGIRHLLLILSVPVLLIVLFAREGLDLWLGAEFARQSEHVVQWLAMGTWSMPSPVCLTQCCKPAAGPISRRSSTYWNCRRTWPCCSC